MIKHTVIGLMSGTSLDGLDMSAVEFIKKDKSWNFNFLKNKTIDYPSDLALKLKNVTQLNGEQLSLLNVNLGEYFGQSAKSFIKDFNLKIDFIASHGHTVFHQPKHKLTLQIGSGQEIANATNLPVVFDFRSKDVSFGGHGAPLVPIGDKLLFSQYDACLNFGGIANVSFENDKSQRVAFDICPFNMPLNYLANLLGLTFDESGSIAKSAKVNQQLLTKLNAIEFYSKSPPKSLGIEWFSVVFLPILNAFNVSTEDKLSTVSYHIAIQITNIINQINGSEILLSGGGVFNTHIVNLIQSLTNKTIVIPKKEIIEFKEALIFGFLGVLRMENEINVLKTVTGALNDSSSGQIVYP